jgi:SOS response regulatory protein OraA/RecX
MQDRFHISRIKRSGDCGVISIEGVDEPLKISLATILELQVVENTIITSSQLERLIDEAGLYACEQEAARLLSLRHHAAAELYLKLKRKQFKAEHIKLALAKAKRLGVLDDEHLALRLSEQLVERRPCGRAYLIAYLQRKHIERSLAERTADVVLSGQDETALAVESLRGRWSRLREFELETAQRKAYNYLARRGFGYAASKAAFERLLKSEHEGNDH